MSVRPRPPHRLETIPGIDPLTASVLVASIGDAKTFKSGRSWCNDPPEPAHLTPLSVLLRGCFHPQRLVRPPSVVPTNPIAHDSAGVLQGLEPMSMYGCNLFLWARNAKKALGNEGRPCMVGWCAPLVLCCADTACIGRAGERGQSRSEAGSRSMLR